MQQSVRIQGHEYVRGIKKGSIIAQTGSLDQYARANEDVVKGVCNMEGKGEIVHRCVSGKLIPRGIKRD